MRLLPSSLDSLANGWRAVGGGEFLGSYAGILAPPHDGDLLVFTGNVRVAFDEAKPMEVQIQKCSKRPVRVRGSSRIQSMSKYETKERLKESFTVIFDVCVQVQKEEVRKEENFLETASSKTPQTLLRNVGKCKQIDDSGI